MATLPSDPRRKVQRAKAHLNSLNKSIIRFTDKYPHSFALSDPKPGGAKNVWVFRLTINVPARKIPDWAVVVGDFAHNARSALDVLLTQALSSREEVHFPIKLAGPAYGEWRSAHARPLKRLSDHQLAVIKQAQPYKATPNDPATDPLAVLATINNGDKHAIVNAIIGFFGASALGFSRHPYISRININTTGAQIEDGAMIALIIVTATRSDFEMEMEAIPAFDVFFERAAQRPRSVPLPADIPVMSILMAIHARIDGIVSDFEREA